MENKGIRIIGIDRSRSEEHLISGYEKRFFLVFELSSEPTKYWEKIFQDELGLETNKHSTINPLGYSVREVSFSSSFMTLVLDASQNSTQNESGGFGSTNFHDWVFSENFNPCWAQLVRAFYKANKKVENMMQVGQERINKADQALKKLLPVINKSLDTGPNE